MTPALIRVIDLETTGLEKPADCAGICEVGWTDLYVKGLGQDEHILASSWNAILCNPGCPIPPTASAVHHIIDDDVAEAMPAIDALHILYDEPSSFDRLPDIYAAHNMKFDRSFYDPKPERKWICTYRCAHNLWPQAPSFGNQALRYWLKLPRRAGRDVAAHSAGPDTQITADILIRMIDEVNFDLDQLIEWSKYPPLLRVVDFGKYEGDEWSSLPNDYLEWLLGAHEKALSGRGGQPFKDEVVHTARHWLKKNSEQGELL